LLLFLLNKDIFLLFVMFLLITFFSFLLDLFFYEALNTINVL